MANDAREQDLYQRDEYQQQDAQRRHQPVQGVQGAILGVHMGLPPRNRGLNQPPRLHGPGTQPRDRQPLIAAAAIDQNTALESLWQTIQLLEDRLQPVLAPIGPQGQGNQGSVGVALAPILPPLAEQLQIATRKIQAAEFKIRELVDRVEV